MRFFMWIFTIVFALAGLALRADRGALLGPDLASLNVYLVKGLFILAVLACPFFWARSYGLVPRALQVPGRQRFMMALALLLAAPLILPWTH